MGLDTPVPLKVAKKQYLAVTPEELERLRAMPIVTEKPLPGKA